MQPNVIAAETVKSKIEQRIKDAMREQNKPLLSVLRGVLKAIVDQEKIAGTQLSQQDGEVLLKRLAKQRAESAEIFKANNRQDLADVELYELNIINEYAPKQLDEAQTRQAIEQIIADGAANVGAVMKSLKEKSLQVDGKLASKLAAELVNKK